MERRNCQAIIKQMMEKIPSDKTDFIKDLEWNFEDAGYKAPEETLQWERTMKNAGPSSLKRVVGWVQPKSK